MKRRAWVVLLVVVLVLVVAVTAIASSGGDDKGGYRVRAIFDSAAFVIPGENVKIGGVVVGKVESAKLTPTNQAAITIEITEPIYQDFRQDATCRVGLQSLIGEQFIECVPTKPRADGVAPAPRLRKIAKGVGKGAYLLPVSQTSSPVGPDLLANINRVPEQDRLRVILNEFGAAVAGNGGELRDAIHRANPTLQQANRFVEILAQQNKVIEQLTVQSDQILAPLARKRQDLSGFIRTAGQAAAASADKGDALEANFQKFPAFLKELKPATERLSALADQVGPSVANLSAQAPALNKAVTNFGPFVKASGPAVETLGDAADRGRKTFPRIRPLVDQFGRLAKPLAPLAADLAQLGGSFDQTGGIENLVRLVYYYTGTLNGKDATSHYLRSKAIAVGCPERTKTPIGGPACNGKFHTGSPLEDGEDASARSVATGAGAAETSAGASDTAPVSDMSKSLESLLGPETKAKP